MNTLLFGESIIEYRRDENVDKFIYGEHIDCNKYQKIVFNDTELLNTHITNLLFENVTHLAIVANINITNLTIFFPNVKHIYDENHFVRFDEIFKFKNTLETYILLESPVGFQNVDLTSLTKLKRLECGDPNSTFIFNKCYNLEHVELYMGYILKRFFFHVPGVPYLFKTHDCILPQFTHGCIDDGELILNVGDYHESSHNIKLCPIKTYSNTP